MMRDRDMADVDVTSRGIWERESDVWYEELVRREVENARRGIVPNENSGKPRAKGGMLTEANIAVWLTMVRLRSLTRKNEDEMLVPALLVRVDHLSSPVSAFFYDCSFLMNY